MKIQLVRESWESIECEALFVPVFENEDEGDGFRVALDQKLDGLLEELRSTEEWPSGAGGVRVIYRPQKLKAIRLVLLGAGKKEDFDSRLVRNLIMKAMHQVSGIKLNRIAYYSRGQAEPKHAAQAAVEGVLLATYQADDYKTEKRSKCVVEEILLIGTEGMDSVEVEAAMERGEILANATNMARKLVNEPGNRVTPPRLADAAGEVAAACGLEIEVWGEPELEDKGMGAILAVARGSSEPARFIILKHLKASDSAAKPIVLVGKGVTFDSGGLSLKPAQSMEEMKADKAGACAVLAAMQAVAQLGVKKNVIGLIPAVENLPGGRAQRPGDVIRAMNGKTVEVINTDAEGRLILADALSYGQQLEPECMVNIATLTGAVVIALGKFRAGVFCNNDKLYDRVLRASEQSGEKLWRLPLDDEYRKEIESSIADVKNSGNRWGGAITAAKFLQEFVGDVPWCHIDIAGVDLFKSEGSIQGPTGFGVRTLVEIVVDGAE
ncbi:MAG: leucyl aminopeptidase [Acidobacteriota bacterium]